MQLEVNGTLFLRSGSESKLKVYSDPGRRKSLLIFTKTFRKRLHFLSIFYMIMTTT